LSVFGTALGNFWLILSVPFSKIIHFLFGTVFDYLLGPGQTGRVFVQKFNFNQKNSKTMALQPLSDRVLVKAATAEQKTASGIIIPDSAKEKPLKGEVIAVGPGTKDETMQLIVGDVVLYGKYAGTEIEVDGEKLLIMRQSDILAKF
jgi:chaperonin GroES